MKKLIILFVIFCAGLSPVLAKKYCGSLSTLTYETDIYTIQRMSIYNKKSDIKLITIKDLAIIELMIGIVSENPQYEHKTDADDFHWFHGENKDRYFVCVEGSKLRKYQGKYFLDHGTNIRVWKNGKEI